MKSIGLSLILCFLHQPEADELKKIAAEGILTCLQDAVDALEQNQVRCLWKTGSSSMCGTTSFVILKFVHCRMSDKY